MSPSIEAEKFEKSEKDAVIDEVFGQINDDGPNYRNVGWLATSVLLTKTQLGLGVLSVPTAMATLGIIPGVIVLVVISALTSWCAYGIRGFKLRHPEIYSISDVGFLIGGKIGQEIVGYAFWIYMTLSAGSAMLSLTIALNALSTHGTCTAVFVAVVAVAGFLVGSIQTLEQIAWIGWAGLCSIMGSLITLVVAVSLQDRPAAAPATGPWDKDLELFGKTTFVNAMNAVGSIVFAYGSVPAFFSIASEMREPKYFARAAMTAQGFITAVYIAIGVVVYYYCGQYVASPAMGSAGPLFKKTCSVLGINCRLNLYKCYGLALPALLASLTLFTHMPSKWVFVRLLRGTRHLSTNTTIHWLVWFTSVIGVTLFAYVIASAVPVFDDLVGLVGSLLGTFLGLHVLAFMWMIDHPKSSAKSLRNWRILTAWNWLVILLASFILVAGTYGSIALMIQDSQNGNGSRPWTCADNSNSV